MQATSGTFSLDVRDSSAATIDRQPHPSMLYRTPLQLASPVPTGAAHGDVRGTTSPWRGHSAGEFGSPLDDARSLSSSFHSTRRRRGEGSGVAGDGRDWTQTLLDLERMRRENQNRINDTLRPERSPGNSPVEASFARSVSNSSAMSSVRRRRRGMVGGTGTRAASSAPFEEVLMDTHQSAGGFTTTRTDSNNGTPAPVAPFATSSQSRLVLSPTAAAMTTPNATGNRQAACPHAQAEGEEYSPTPKLRTSGLPNWLRLPPPDQVSPVPEAAQLKPARSIPTPAPSDRTKAYVPAPTTAATAATAEPVAVSPPTAAQETPAAEKMTRDSPATVAVAMSTASPHLATPPAANSALAVQRRPTAAAALRALREAAAAAAAAGAAAEQPSTAHTRAEEGEEMPSSAASTTRTGPPSQLISPTSSAVPTPSATRQPVAQTYVARYTRAAAAAAVGLTAAPASPPRARQTAHSTLSTVPSPAAAPATAEKPAARPASPAAEKPAAPPAPPPSATDVAAPPVRTSLSSPSPVMETTAAPRTASLLEGGAEPQPPEVPTSRGRKSASGIEGGEPEPRPSQSTASPAAAEKCEEAAAAATISVAAKESPRPRVASTMRTTRAVRKDPSVMRGPGEEAGMGERPPLSIATARRLMASVSRQRPQVSTARTTRNVGMDGGDAAHPPGQGDAAGGGGARVLHRTTALLEMRRQEVLRDRQQREHRAVEEARACLGPVHPSTSITAPPRRSTERGAGGSGSTADAAAAAVEQTPARRRTTGGSVEAHSTLSQEASPIALQNSRRTASDARLRTQAKDGAANAASATVPAPSPAVSGLTRASRRLAESGAGATPANSARPSTKLAKAGTDASPRLTAACSAPRGGQTHATGTATTSATTAAATGDAAHDAPSPSVSAPASRTRRVALNGPLLGAQPQNAAAPTPSARTPVASARRDATRVKSDISGKSEPRLSATPAATAASLVTGRQAASPEVEVRTTALGSSSLMTTPRVPGKPSPRPTTTVSPPQPERQEEPAPAASSPTQPAKAQAMPFCVECGQRHVNDVAKFCARCGHKRAYV